MEVENDKHATFIFAFRDKPSKDKSYIKLKDFLCENEWIESKDIKKHDYISYHSNFDGTCEITLFKEKPWELPFEEVLDLLFDDLKACEGVKWIKVFFSPTTEKLVSNNMDSSPRFKSQVYEYGCEVYIFYRK